MDEGHSKVYFLPLPDTWRSYIVIFVIFHFVANALVKLWPCFWCLWKRLTLSLPPSCLLRLLFASSSFLFFFNHPLNVSLFPKPRKESKLEYCLQCHVLFPSHPQGGSLEL